MKLDQAWKNLKEKIGIGIITGAADDDPSGIVTYSIAGVYNHRQFLWISWLTLPLMYVVQEMCARLALVTRKGLVGVMKERFSPTLIITISILMFLANTLNIAADLSAVTTTLQLFTPFVPKWVYASLISLVVISLILILPYQKFSAYLKLFVLPLFSYVLVAFAINIDWLDVLKHLLQPQFSFDRKFFIILAAIFGTTISPYLFFWQEEEELEEIQAKERTGETVAVEPELRHARADTFIGMAFSNLIMLFIILTTGVILHDRGGVTAIQSIEELILVLRPIAGPFAHLLFTVGIIGSALVAIPVLAGGSAYSLAEMLNLPASLNKKVIEALPFYLFIVAAIIIANIINLFNVPTINLLFASALIFGFLAPLLITILLRLTSDKQLMGNYTNGPTTTTLVFATIVIMTAGLIAIFLT